MSASLYRKYRVLWLQPIAGGHYVGNGHAHCCVDMSVAVTFACDQHDEPFECADFHIAYNAVTDEYGLPIRDGGACVLLVAHCPFCGLKLPESKRDRWFDEIEALGLSPTDDDVPPAYTTDAWWRAEKLQDT